MINAIDLERRDGTDPNRMLVRYEEDHEWEAAVNFESDAAIDRHDP